MIRPATGDDTEFVWRLTMEPSVLAQSTRGQAFTLEEHRPWYLRRLAEPTTRMWIAEQDSVPVGYVRYGSADPAGAGEAEVSIAVLPEARGRGYAKALLLDTEPQARSALGIERVVGLILSANVASQRLFSVCGYRYEGVIQRLGKTHLRFVKP